MSQSIDLNLENAIFILRSYLNNLQIAIESFGSPVLAVSETIYQNLTYSQILSLEKSFLSRANGLKTDLVKLNKQLSLANNIEDLVMLQHNIQYLSNRYFLCEKVHDYFVDSLHTRSEHGMGKVLKGCDQIATASLKLGLEKLGYEVPTIICHLDAGRGAAIIAAGIFLWDYQPNPAALIKIVVSAIPFPRLTSVCHECGHQFDKITGWVNELAPIIYSSIISAGYSKELAKYWSTCTSEISADMYALSQTNFASVVGLSEVLISSPNTMFTFFPNDPHPIARSRIMLSIMACRTVLGAGPWNDYEKALDTLFPFNMAQPKAAKIIMESQPLLELLCKVILNTKMACFSGKSLSQILPWNIASPTSIKNYLIKDQSDFSVSRDVLMKDPIIALTCFRYIHMFGGRSQKWVADKMRDWLISLSSRSDY